MSLACGAGLYIGAIIALSLALDFWWVVAGALAGGIIGLLGYDMETVTNAMLRAWHVTIVWDPRPYLYPQTKADWQKQTLISIWKGVLFGMFLSIFCPFTTPQDFQSMGWFGLVSMLWWLIFFIISAYLYVEYDGRESRGLSFGLSDIATGFLVSILWPLLAILWLFCEGVPRAKHLLIAVHRDRRLLCFVGAAIGATVGFITGNVIFAFMGAPIGWCICRVYTIGRGDIVW